MAWGHAGSGERTGGHRSDPDWLPDSDHTMPGRTSPGPRPPGSSRYGRLLETDVNYTDTNPSRPTVIILSVCKGACGYPGGSLLHAPVRQLFKAKTLLPNRLDPATPSGWWRKEGGD